MKTRPLFGFALGLILPTVVGCAAGSEQSNVAPTANGASDTAVQHSYSGEELFRGIMFDTGPVARLLPAVWTNPALHESSGEASGTLHNAIREALSASSQPDVPANALPRFLKYVDAATSVPLGRFSVSAAGATKMQRLVIRAINKTDATFFPRFGVQVQSGDAALIDSALHEGTKLLLGAVMKSPQGVPRFHDEVCGFGACGDGINDGFGGCGYGGDLCGLGCGYIGGGYLNVGGFGAGSYGGGGTVITLPDGGVALVGSGGGGGTVITSGACGAGLYACGVLAYSCGYTGVSVGGFGGCGFGACGDGYSCGAGACGFGGCGLVLQGKRRGAAATAADAGAAAVGDTAASDANGGGILIHAIDSTVVLTVDRQPVIQQIAANLKAS